MAQADPSRGGKARVGTGSSPAGHDYGDELARMLWEEETPAVSLYSLAIADPTRRQASLLPMSGSRLGEAFRLSKKVTVIGRSPDADLLLDDHGVSRRHAEIVVEGERAVLRDLSSRNGIFVNGLGVEEHALEDGDRITIGRNVILKFLLQDEIDERFQERLLESLTVDGLTGAHTRRAFVHRLQTECGYSRRHAQPLSLLFLDIDHFKEINDTYGHIAGDLVLREVVQVLLELLRGEDFVGRYGGEEFLIALRGTEGREALLVAERLRRAIEARRVVAESGPIGVTTSVGVASLVLDARDTPKALIAAADAACYAAKRSGRNKTVAAS